MICGGPPGPLGSILHSASSHEVAYIPARSQEVAKKIVVSDHTPSLVILERAFACCSSEGPRVFLCRCFYQFSFDTRASPDELFPELPQLFLFPTACSQRRCGFRLLLPDAVMQCWSASVSVHSPSPEPDANPVFAGSEATPGGNQRWPRF